MLRSWMEQVPGAACAEEGAPGPRGARARGRIRGLTKRPVFDRINEQLNICFQKVLRRRAE